MADAFDNGIEDCFLLKVHLSAIDDLDRVIDRFLAYGTTTTSIIQSSPVPLRSPPLPDGARSPRRNRRRKSNG